MASGLIRGAIVAGAALAPAIACPALGQEAINMPAATMPSPGSVSANLRFRYVSLDDDPTPADRRIKQGVIDLSAAVGIAQGLAVSLEAPLVFRQTRSAPSGGLDHEQGVADMTALLRWRVFKEDFGPLDTARLNLLVGVEIPTYDDEFSSESWDPMVGGVFTLITGRHGVNASVLYELTTGANRAPVEFGESLADALRYDASHLFRLAPAQFGEGDDSALYTVLEINGRYETNGDHQIYLSPGLLFESRRWALEAGVQIPVWQSLDHRPETEIAVTIGVRLFF